MSDTELDERVTDEIEALCAILLDDELKVTKNDEGLPINIETLVVPSTGEDCKSQYVCITLSANLPKGYPDISPSIILKNPRGLDEQTVKKIKYETELKCNDFIGQPVMFELIELVRENLTMSNLPTGQCVICLYGFREGDEFIKTDCYHHFHSYCLGRHVDAAEKNYKEEYEKLPQWQQDTVNKFQAICPVCREFINCNVDKLCLASPPIDVETANEFFVSDELRELQRNMAILYLKQQEKGGIIDPEAEGVKMLLRTDDDSATGDDDNASPPAGPSLTTLVRQEPKNTGQQSNDKTTSDCRQQSQNNNQNNCGRKYRGGRGRGRNNHHHHHRRNHERLRQTETTPR